jgi:transglutaminase-like putative cysteine protease
MQKVIEETWNNVTNNERTNRTQIIGLFNIIKYTPFIYYYKRKTKTKGSYHIRKEKEKKNSGSSF